MDNKQNFKLNTVYFIMQLDPDLGRQMIEQGAKNGQDVFLADLTFCIAQAYFNLDINGTGTISIITDKGFCGSLEFGEDLKFQVLHLLSKITKIEEDQFQKVNNSEMVVFDFAKIGGDKTWISGVLLNGKLGKNQIAMPTGEVFVPIILDRIELIDSCLVTENGFVKNISEPNLQELSQKNSIVCLDPINNIYQVPKVDQVMYYNFETDFANLESVGQIFLTIKANIIKVLFAIQNDNKYQKFSFYGYFTMKKSGIIFAISKFDDNYDAEICNLFAGTFTKNIEAYSEAGLWTITNTESNFPLFCKDGSKIITFYPDQFPPFPCKEIQNGSCIVMK